MEASGSNVETTSNEVKGRNYPQSLATHDVIFNDPSIFWKTLKRFFHSMGTKLIVPVIDGRSLDLHLLYVNVTTRGGYEKVTSNRKWKDVSSIFMFSPTATSVSFVLKKHYSHLLYHYEQVYFLRSNGVSQYSDIYPSGKYESSLLVNGVNESKLEWGHNISLDATSQAYIIPSSTTTTTCITNIKMDDNVTLESVAKARSASLALPSNIMTIDLLCNVGNNSTTTLFDNIAIKQLPTEATSLSLGPPSNTMKFDHISIMDLSLLPLTNTLMIDPPANTKGNPVVTQSSTTPAKEKLTKSSNLSIVPLTTTVMFDPPANVGGNSSESQSNNTTTLDIPTNASIISLTTLSNNENTSEQHTKAPKFNKKRLCRDPNYPKHTRSGYTYFVAKKHGEMKSIHPYTSMGKITKMIGKAWKRIAKEEKLVYEQMGMEDKERYKKEKQEYEETNINIKLRV